MYGSCSRFYKIHDTCRCLLHSFFAFFLFSAAACRAGLILQPWMSLIETRPAHNRAGGGWLFKGRNFKLFVICVTMRRAKLLSCFEDRPASGCRVRKLNARKRTSETQCGVYRTRRLMIPYLVIRIPSEECSPATRSRVMGNGKTHRLGERAS
jgi:hypothetical protein